jgi:hypothetical protein
MVAHDEVVQRLTRIETKLDAALECDKDHEKRLRGLEHKQWWLSGVAAVAGFLASHFGPGFKL